LIKYTQNLKTNGTIEMAKRLSTTTADWSEERK